MLLRRLVLGVFALASVIIPTTAFVTPTRPTAEQYPQTELTYDAQVLIERVELLAWYLQNEKISLAHVAMCLLEGIHEDFAMHAITSAGGNYVKVRGAVKAALIRQPRTRGTLMYGESLASETLKRAMVAAYKLADLESSRIGIHHLHFVLLSVPTFRKFLLKAGTDLTAYKFSIEKTYKGKQYNQISKTYNEFAGGGNDSKAEGHLSAFGTDLTFMAERGLLQPVVGRSEEIDRLIRILNRKQAKVPLLLGEPGIGKKSIIDGFAQRLYMGAVPDGLKGRRIFSLDILALSSGGGSRNEFETRLREIVAYLKRHKRDTILFVEGIEQLFQAQKGNSGFDINLFKIPLIKGEICAIGATTYEDFKREIEKDKALERAFEKVVVTAPSIERTITIVNSLKAQYEKYHRLTIPEEIIVSIVKLSDQHIKDKHFPEKALGLLDSACAFHRSLSVGTFSPLTEELKDKLLIDVSTLSDPDVETLISAAPFLTYDERARVLSSPAFTEEFVQRFEAAIEYYNSGFTSRFTRSGELFFPDPDGTHVLVDGKYVEDLTVFKRDADGELLRGPDGKYVVDPDLQKNTPVGVLTIQDVGQVLSEITGLPLSKMTEDEKTKILKLPEILGERVVGQFEAVKSVSDAIIRQRAGLNPKNQPLGSFLFLGSSGVGKTELAKVLAYQLFNTEKNLIRLDMSEYQEAHSISRLIGSPPGYMGNDEGGQLTEAVRQKPYSVVLFDEVENAHANIWSILLPLLDDGRLTDTRGITVDFSKTIIILTSNIGQQHILEGYTEARGLAQGNVTPLATFNKDSNKLEHFAKANAGADAAASYKKNTAGEAVNKTQNNAWNNAGKSPKEVLKQMRAKVMKELLTFFKPQVIGRITEIIMFEPLSPSAIRGVLALKFQGLGDLLREQGIDFRVTDSAITFTIERAWSNKYGFRPIIKFMEKYIAARIAPLIISERLKKGHRAVLRVDSKNPNRLNLIICTLKDEKCVVGSTYGVGLTVLPPKAAAAPGEEEDPLV